MPRPWWEDYEVDDDEDEDDPSPRFAGHQLVELLIWLKLSGTLTAKYVCLIAYWASRADGHLEEVGKLGKKPKSPSGHFQRHLDRVLGVEEEIAERQAKLKVPCYLRHANERHVRDVSVSIAHEALNEEVVNNEFAHVHLRDKQSRNLLPPAYWSHPIVQRDGAEGIFPLAVYLDGTPFNKRNSVLRQPLS